MTLQIKNISVPWWYTVLTSPDGILKVSLSQSIGLMLIGLCLEA